MHNLIYFIDLQENTDLKRKSNIHDDQEPLIWKTMEADIINLSDEDNFSSLLEFESSFGKEGGLQKPNQKDDTDDYNQEPIAIDSVAEVLENSNLFNLILMYICMNSFELGMIFFFSLKKEKSNLRIFNID